MGEIADMMIDGFLDCETGELIDGESPGYPRTASGAYPFASDNNRAAKVRVKCPKCGKRVSAVGLKQHERDKHGT